MLLNHRASDIWEGIEKKYTKDDASKNNELVSLLQNVPGCKNSGLLDINNWLEMMALMIY